MDAPDIREFIEDNFPGVAVVESEGDHFFVYDTENKVPFATILTSSRHDTHSDLDRPGVFRLNIGVSKTTYRALFSTDTLPAESGFDFTAFDRIMPHPEYGRTYWICILNPSEATFEDIRPMLSVAYDLAVKKFDAFKKASSMR